MNRRVFIKKYIKLGIALWLGSALLPENAFAATKQKVRIRNIRKKVSSRKEKAEYFRLIINLSAKCSIEDKKTGGQYHVQLKNCSADNNERTTMIKNKFISAYAVDEKQDDVHIVLKLKDSSISCRTYLLEPDSKNKYYRLFIDIGNLKSEKAEEAEPKPQPIGSVRVWETYLNFGDMDKRAATRRIVVHHVGNTNNDVSAAEIHRWHLHNGWSGIGYHYVIRKDGMIERGRPAEMIGAHVYGYNKDSIGICVVGEYEAYEPEQQQVDALTALVAQLCRKYRIAPNIETVCGHRDLNATACPGKNLYRYLPQVRRDVLAVL